MTTFRNPLADPLGTRRGPPLVRRPQFENRCTTTLHDFSLIHNVQRNTTNQTDRTARLCNMPHTTT